MTWQHSLQKWWKTKISHPTFLVAINSASKASTRQTAAFNNSSFSQGISEGLDWSVSTFSSSSPNLFIKEGRRFSSGVDEGRTSMFVVSRVGSEVLWSSLDDSAGSFFVTLQATWRKRANNIKKKEVNATQIWAWIPCGVFWSSGRWRNPV